MYMVQNSDTMNEPLVVYLVELEEVHHSELEKMEARREDSLVQRQTRSDLKALYYGSSLHPCKSRVYTLLP